MEYNLTDKNADMYEANLMRRLSGLLYLDKKLLVILKKNKKGHNMTYLVNENVLNAN